MKDEKFDSVCKASGRYPGKATCHNPDFKKPCQNPAHFRDGQHFDVVIHYHIPFLGVVKTQDLTEDAADKTAQQIIYAELSKLYLSRTKELMQLEQLIDSVNQLVSK